MISIDFREIWDFIEHKETPYIRRIMPAISTLSMLVVQGLAKYAGDGILRDFISRYPPKSQRSDYPFEYTHAPMSHPERTTLSRPSHPSHWQAFYHSGRTRKYQRVKGQKKLKVITSDRGFLSFKKIQQAGKQRRSAFALGKLDIWFDPQEEQADQIMGCVTNIGHDAKPSTVAGPHEMDTGNYMIFPDPAVWRTGQASQTLIKTKHVAHPGVTAVRLSNGQVIQPTQWLQMVRGQMNRIYQDNLNKVNKSELTQYVGQGMKDVK